MSKLSGVIEFEGARSRLPRGVSHEFDRLVASTLGFFCQGAIGGVRVIRQRLQLGHTLGRKAMKWSGARLYRPVECWGCFSAVLLAAVFLLVPANAIGADSFGDDLSEWIDEQGRQAWGKPPEACDDLTFARRVYLDLLGRVPSVAEVRDYLRLGDNRRDELVNELVFGQGQRRKQYVRLGAEHLARQWRRVLVPPGSTTLMPTGGLETWLADSFRDQRPLDEVMRDIVQIASPNEVGGYYQLLGGTPESYAGNLSRAMLGIRIDCAQCHDHPFADWTQDDFWGLAAFYSDLNLQSNLPNASRPTRKGGEIQFEGTTYVAKFLWEDESVPDAARTPRVRLAKWLTSSENPNFSANIVNRFWQMLVGQGLYEDVENLDQASESEREFLDDLGKQFAEDDFHVGRLVAAICKSDWYSAKVTDSAGQDASPFKRGMKVISPEQVFDSLEQSLHLPIGRVDSDAPRWTATRTQMVNRLGEAIGETPEDYASGIPQALMMMNGRITADAINPKDSRLLRAVIEAPFFDKDKRIETLYLAVLTRKPTESETETLAKYLDEKPDDDARKKGFGEILWALLNSPEFVLCR